MKINKTQMTLMGYWVEAKMSRLLLMFGVVFDIKNIPEGMYCYTIDEERNKKEPTNGYWTKPCPYYRSTHKTGGRACTYLGYYGWDACLYDQCKICGIKDD